METEALALCLWDLGATPRQHCQHYGQITRKTCHIPITVGVRSGPPLSACRVAQPSMVVEAASLWD
jgi:hypothetical protein